MRMGCSYKEKNKEIWSSIIIKANVKERIEKKLIGQKSITKVSMLKLHSNRETRTSWAWEIEKVKSNWIN